MTDGKNAASIGAMQRFLRPWRLHKNFTQEEVAAKLGVAHSTISRWENSSMAIDTAGLTSLARLYGCTPAQLVGGPPDTAEQVAKLTQVQDILSDLPEDVQREWLAIGRRLAGHKE